MLHYQEDWELTLKMITNSKPWFRTQLYDHNFNLFLINAPAINCRFLINSFLIKDFWQTNWNLQTSNNFAYLWPFLSVAIIIISLFRALCAFSCFKRIKDISWIWELVVGVGYLGARTSWISFRFN